MTKPMKSLVLKGVRNFELKQVPVPETVGPKDVLIKVKGAAICHTDYSVMDAQHPWTRFPCVLGHEFSGIVGIAGQAVSHVKPGGHVTAISYGYCGVCKNCRKGIHAGCSDIIAIPFNYDGAFQEYMITPGIAVYKISDAMDFEDAAVVECAANAYSIVDRSNIYPGEKVLIAGPGPIGLFSVQFAKLKQPGMLIVSGTRDERLNVARELGATHTINIKKEDPYEKIMEITGGEGLDVIFYCGGGREVWELAEKTLAIFGRFIIEAVPPQVDEKYPVSSFKFLDKCLTYTGVAGYDAAQFEVALRMIESGKINTKKLITHRFKLEDYKEAFDTAENRKAGAIKVVFNSF